MGTTTGFHLTSAAKPPPFPSSISLPHPRFPPTSYFPPPRPLPLVEIQKKQLNNIIDALNRAGDFARWINLLSSINPSSLPLTATLFVPSNDAISGFPTANAAGMNFDAFIVPYHIVPQRLSFSDLQQFPILTRLPTLFPSKFIVITNTSRFNFTLDDSLVTHPDILVNAAFSVHGINKVLDYNVYGSNDNGLFSPPPPPGKTAASTHMPKPILMPPSPNDPKPVEGTIILPPSPNDMKPEEETIIEVSFGVARLSNVFFVVFFWIFVLFLHPRFIEIPTD
ncbi:Hypothetical predicted protein [Olea europaea subsp. europaea]|uniref:FAS1 domain-containing protein n=2 Tax=Olea europaea subsp. europaea TaxID=158383 RepID=A0A8S0TR74_OLEEU|nr:Hypothetical predicted protein [Olea europaea subsp. europaea]